MLYNNIHYEIFVLMLKPQVLVLNQMNLFCCEQNNFFRTFSYNLMCLELWLCYEILMCKHKKFVFLGKNLCLQKIAVVHNFL